MRQLFFIAIFFITIQASANDAILGAGGATCGRWVENRKAGVYHHQLNWVLGFVSSYNYYVYTGNEEYGMIGAADADSVAVWMDNYCQKNPLENVFDGSVRLVQELKARAR